MKKLLILIALVLLVSGCTNIQDSSYDELITSVLESKADIYNTYRKGYKFYLPTGMFITSTKEYNEVIENDEDKFYLYIDVISYLSENTIEPDEEENIYYRELKKGKKVGYATIKVKEKDKYLVEIAYNYAKIEVIVESDRVNKALTEGMIILSSIDYNDSFLKSLNEETLLNYKEEEVDLFDKAGGKDTSNFLEYAEDYDGSEEDVIPDYDLIK